MTTFPSSMDIDIAMWPPSDQWGRNNLYGLKVTPIKEGSPTSLSFPLLEWQALKHLDLKPLSWEKQVDNVEKQSQPLVTYSEF